MALCGSPCCDRTEPEACSIPMGISKQPNFWCERALIIPCTPVQTVNGGCGGPSRVCPVAAVAVVVTRREVFYMGKMNKDKIRSKQTTVAERRYGSNWKGKLVDGRCGPC